MLVSGVQPSASTIIYFRKCPSDISSTHLALCMVITILLTIFPVLYFISPDYFVITNRIIYFEIRKRNLTTVSEKATFELWTDFLGKIILETEGYITVKRK